MIPQRSHSSVIQAGDTQGLGRVYTRSGDLIVLPDEQVLRVARNWDVDVISPWRRVLPNVLFPGFRGEARSTLHITTKRIVLIREIDEWRELSGELTPLGLPTAAAKEKRLKSIKRAGVREFCQIQPNALAIAACRKFVKRQCMLDLELNGDDGRQYAILFWKTDGRDEDTLGLIQSRFREGPENARLRSQQGRH